MDALREAPARPLTATDLATVADFPLGDATVSPSRRKIVGPSGEADLQPRVMQVLVLLAQSADQVVSRETLLDRCWGGVYVGDDSLNRVVGALRKVATKTGATSFEIETVPRVGYRLVTNHDGRVAEPARTHPRRRVFAVLATILVVALAGLAIYLRARTSEPPQPTIAVLPFTALNADRDAVDFGRSVSATVANALAQTGARVPDNVRSMDDARGAGAALLVAGTVRRDGSAFRVTARVDSVSGNATIMSNDFQADARATSDLGSRVAAWLIPPVRMWASFLPFDSEPSTSTQILRIFLTRQAGDGVRAWRLARSLAASKPDSGPAQLVEALLTSDVLAFIPPEQRRSEIEFARRSADSAARLLPDPQRALAVRDCHLTAPGWHVLTPSCDRRTRAALSANPDVPLLPMLFGAELMDSGRFVEAVKFADMDLAQSPLGSPQLALRIYATRMTRRGDTIDVLPQLEDRLRRYGAPGELAYFDFHVALADGDIKTASAILDSAQGTSIVNGDEKATIDAVFVAVGSGAQKDIATMKQRCDPAQPGSTPDGVVLEACLIGLSLTNHLDDMFALARRGYRDVDCCSAAQQQEQWLASGGQYNPRAELFGKAMARARADPRFIEIARRTGLLAYWRSGHPPDFCGFEHAPVCALLHTNP